MKTHLTINDERIDVRPRETLLSAALRQGIDFPSGCRVGGCGACKCKVVEGEVKELTETGYLLTAEELEEGYVLACQSVPKTDVRVEVELGARGVSGVVAAQQKVTHDITRLEVELDAPLDFRPGQFASLSLEGLEGVVRSYSFAEPPRADGRVAFYVRRVPGGRFSTVVNDEDLVGRRARVDGPSGDFWLRPGDAPVILAAGGSGLAPILAMLDAAADAGVSRSVTLLFGAREARDLYALDRIEAIAARWKGAFTFVPVLSEAEGDDAWDGARGLVTEHLAAHLEPGAHAYLCGPPKMVDAARALLEAHGVADVRFDRFTTQADAAPPEAPRRPVLDVLHYLKFFSFHLVGLFSAATLLAGGHYVTAGLLGVLALYVLGDALFGDDDSTPRFRYPQILTAQLWLALPLLALIVFVSVWSVCDADVLGFGALVQRLTGFDALAARAATGFGHHVSGVIITGLMIGMVGTIPAHELTHRTWDRVSMLIGRWLLAFSFDTGFAIEHVYGHHRYVSTTEDPATAPRGRNVYAHVLLSTVRGNVSAWRIEAERLAKKRLPVWSRHNAFVRGHLMSVALVILASAMGGPVAAGYFALCALWGKALLEIVNYMEHYGMVRNPSLPVQPRHSWNSNRRVSSWSMFNLTRHSHHHAHGEVPYQDLRPYPDAPMMIGGYLTTILVTLIPPLWHHLMVPKLVAWDRDHASEEERGLAAEANARSGLVALERQPGTGSGHLSFARRE
ncbi:MAG: fatty acid desaturase [Myxococcales bacterium]|nr:fatty acid desaturase [Myxococcales bacterium]